jgi:hypothetical protein
MCSIRCSYQGSYHVPAIVAMLEKIYRSDTLSYNIEVTRSIMCYHNCDSGCTIFAQFLIGIYRITLLTGSEIRVINTIRKSGLENRVGNPGEKSGCQKSGSEIRVGNLGEKSG